jgi:hypothetical protein
MQLGVRQARYFGRVKTLYQLLMAAMVANLTLVATRTGLMRGQAGGGSSLFADFADHLLALVSSLTLSVACYFDLTQQLNPKSGVVG